MMTAVGAAALPDLRYPVGAFDSTVVVSHDARSSLVDTIAALPADLRASVDGLTDEQLDTRYRDGGWTVRQVVHHVADSHMNAAIRFRLALTEELPTIKPYAEAAWAELPDARTLPVEPSLQLLDGLHARWTVLLRAMTPEQYDRTLMHPERGPMTLSAMLRLYDWHCRHHVAHITRLHDRLGW